MTRLKRRKELPSTHRHDVRFGTPELVAQYRAMRLAALEPETIIEVGAGAGFQTGAFARVAKRVIAVDIDAERLARATLPPNAVAVPGDALDPAVFERIKGLAHGKTAVFLDPERPPASEERTLAEIRPDIGRFVELYSRIAQEIAIELPPFLKEVPQGCEREYLSVDGKLNRLTIYFGRLRRCETSVVRLPAGDRLEHDGPSPQMRESRVHPRFILEPDAALAHAQLTAAELKTPVQALSLGRRAVFLSGEKNASPFFTAYKVLATSEQAVIKALPSMDCATVIVHGALDQGRQRELLGRLNRLCRGKRRLHLFLGEQWYLTSKTAPQA